MIVGHLLEGACILMELVAVNGCQIVIIDPFTNDIAISLIGRVAIIKRKRVYMPREWI